MEIQVTTNDNILIVTVEGKLDALSESECEERLMQLIAAGTQSMVMDFYALTYISSAGLRVLLKIAKTMRAKGARLVFVNLRDNVREIFGVTGLTSILTVRDSLATALAEL